MGTLIVSFDPTPDEHDEPTHAADGELADAAFVVVLQDGEPLAPVDRARGRLRYVIGDDVDHARLALSVAGGAEQPFPTALIDTMRSSDAETYLMMPRTLTTTRPLSEAPIVSQFRPRVAVDLSKGVPVPELAGLPVEGTDHDRWRLPVTGLPVKEVVNYLAPCGDLRPDQDWAPGFLHELEMHWEPLGWALDEWISTVALGPYEDTMSAEGLVSGASSLQEQSEAGASDSSQSTTNGTRSASDQMRVAARQTGRQTGFTAGLGRTTSSSASLGIANPITSLAEAVTGAVQIGFSTGRINASSGSTADLQREVVNTVETTTRLDRERSAAALAQSIGSFTNSRQLRALRNVAGPRTLNLAYFTVVRHWLVTTLESRVRPVVLVRVEGVDEEFTARDVFLHREVLSGVLLDETLRPALDEVAAGYTPTPPTVPAPEPEIVTSIKVTATVADPAEGPGSRIEVAALFKTDRGYVVPVSREVEAKETSQPLVCNLQADRPLAQLQGWRFHFRNPGRWNQDHEAQLDDVSAEIVIRRGTETETRVVQLGNQIQLRENSPKILDRKVPRTQPETTVPDPRLGRLLTHLEANRTYYRLAIDLASDPSQRFERLAKRAVGHSTPTDMRPVGITGTHLAFLVDQSPIPQPAPLLPKPICQLASTPAGGTFMEAIGGSRITTEFKEAKELPTLTPGSTPQLVWPDLEAPASLTRSSNGQLEDKDPQSGAATEFDEDQLGAQLTAARDALTKAGEALKALQEQTGRLPPTAPGAPPGAGKPAEGSGKDGKDGSGQTPPGNNAAEKQAGSGGTPQGGDPKGEGA